MIDKLDDMLHFHHQALNLRAHRQQVLASNIANADTPGYKARDFDFRAALASAVAPVTTGATPANAPASPPELLYRQVIQPSVDGNTVDMDVERAQFAENAIRYEAGVTALTHQIRTMLAAIQG
ncbi:MAG: flagellar basal body rod protein FlgB [Burkholderiales bacterium]